MDSVDCTYALPATSISQCVRLNRLSVGFRTHPKSLQFHVQHTVSTVPVGLHGNMRWRVVQSHLRQCVITHQQHLTRLRSLDHGDLSSGRAQTNTKWWGPRSLHISAPRPSGTNFRHTFELRTSVVNNSHDDWRLICLRAPTRWRRLGEHLLKNGQHMYWMTGKTDHHYSIIITSISRNKLTG